MMSLFSRSGLGGAAMAGAALLMLVAGTASAQTPDPNSGAITLTSAVDFPSVYFFRGIRQESDPKLTTFAAGDIGISLFTGDGALKSASVNVGVWNSLHTGTSGLDAQKGSHYEEDFYAALSLGFGGGMTVVPTFTAYTSPNTSFGTVQELSVKLAHASKFAPYGLVAFELKGQADGGSNEGTYAEFGIGPSWALGGSSVTLGVPVKVGLSVKDYYQTATGSDNKFGYVDAGLLLTVPFTRIPTQYGLWNVHGGVNVLGFGDVTRALNNGDAAQVIVSGGIGISY